MTDPHEVKPFSEVYMIDPRKVSDTDMHIGLHDAARMLVAYPRVQSLSEIQALEELERTAHVNRREALFKSGNLDDQAAFGAANSAKEAEDERRLDKALLMILSAAADSSTRMEIAASKERGGSPKSLSELEVTGLKVDFSGRDILVDASDNAVWHGVRVNRMDLAAFASSNGQVVTYTTGAPGRPSSMHLIRTEAERRIADSEYEMPLSKVDFARQLIAWMANLHPGAAPTQIKTATNDLELTRIYHSRIGKPKMK